MDKKLFSLSCALIPVCLVADGRDELRYRFFFFVKLFFMFEEPTHIKVYALWMGVEPNRDVVCRDLRLLRRKRASEREALDCVSLDGPI